MTYHVVDPTGIGRTAERYRQRRDAADDNIEPAVKSAPLLRILDVIWDPVDDVRILFRAGTGVILGQDLLEGSDV